MVRTDAQKEADRRYARKIQQEGKYTRFSTTLPTDEAEALNAALQAARLTKTDFIRRAFARLQKGDL